MIGNKKEPEEEMMKIKKKKPEETLLYIYKIATKTKTYFFVN